VKKNSFEIVPIGTLERNCTAKRPRMMMTILEKIRALLRAATSRTQKVGSIWARPQAFIADGRQSPFYRPGGRSILRGLGQKEDQKEGRIVL